MLQKLDELREDQYVSPFCVALIHTGLGQVDEAFAWLHKAFDTHDHWMETLGVHPAIDTLRDDPRYGALLDKMRLAG
jgi:hypothetical protein